MQASLLTSSGHTPTVDLEQGPSRQGGSVVCRLQARLSPLWAPAPHPGAFPTLSQKAFTQAGRGCLVMPGRRQTRSCPWPHGSFLRGAAFRGGQFGLSLHSCRSGAGTQTRPWKLRLLPLGQELLWVQGTPRVTLSTRMNACVNERMGCRPELQPLAARPVRPGRATSGAGGGWPPPPGACPQGTYPHLSSGRDISWVLRRTKWEAPKPGHSVRRATGAEMCSPPPLSFCRSLAARAIPTAPAGPGPRELWGASSRRSPSTRYRGVKTRETQSPP